MEREDVKLSIGTDAHIKTHVGKIEYPLNFIKSYSATQRLIFLNELI